MELENKNLANPLTETVTVSLPINEMKTLLGETNQHLLMMQKALGIKIVNRGDVFKLSANQSKKLNHAVHIFYELIQINQKLPLNISFLAKFLQENSEQSNEFKQSQIKIGRKSIVAKSSNQASFIKNLTRFAVNFATGPAGCGKSWLSVAYALSCFDSGEVEKIILTRPVLEAGEKLGFLPGDLTQKIDPFLKPLYDALYEMYPSSKIDQLLSSKKIEVLPLAYMRGRTLNEAIIILDEAQNTTPTQMKMFLTRMGYNSKLIISGDLNQSDLPTNQISGLKDAKNRLEKLNEIGFCNFENSDIVRHPLIKQIIECYENNNFAVKPNKSKTEI